MKANDGRVALFDQWAQAYDPASDGDDMFPFAGYEAVLSKIAERAAVVNGMQVLDLGIGTGNLAAKFSDIECDLWGLDFSEKMLQRAHERLPRLRLIQADLLQPFPPTLPGAFDRIVSAYVLHEFKDSIKVRLLQRLVEDYLTPDGFIVLGDIAFENADVRAKANNQWARVWDEDEHYWAAEEAIELLAQAGLHAEYQQVSICAGVFVVKPGG